MTKINTGSKLNNVMLAAELIFDKIQDGGGRNFEFPQTQ